jgi:hypothetical protein
MNYAYNFAYVEIETNMCVEILTTSDPNHGEGETPGFVQVQLPVYDEEYLGKYYINGSWYEDAEGTIPWTSSLL